MRSEASARIDPGFPHDRVPPWSVQPRISGLAVSPEVAHVNLTKLTGKRLDMHGWGLGARIGVVNWDTGRQSKGGAPCLGVYSFNSSVHGSSSRFMPNVIWSLSQLWCLVIWLRASSESQVSCLDPYCWMWRTTSMQVSHLGHGTSYICLLWRYLPPP